MHRTGEEIASELDGIAKEIDDTNYTFVHMRQEKMRSLTARRDALLEEHKAALDRQSYVTIPVYGWTCFHCGERFYEVDKAREHFGTVPSAKVVCDRSQEVEKPDENGLYGNQRPESWMRQHPPVYDPNTLTDVINNKLNPPKDANGFTATDRQIMRDDPT